MDRAQLIAALQEHGVDVESLTAECEASRALLSSIGVTNPTDPSALSIVQNLHNRSTRLSELETEIKQKKANDRVDTLVKSFKIMPAHREVWLSHAESMTDEAWSTLTSTLQPFKPVAPVTSGQLSTHVGTPNAPSAEMLDLGDGQTESKADYVARMAGMVKQIRPDAAK
jgi:hypothetical protein